MEAATGEIVAGDGVPRHEVQRRIKVCVCAVGGVVWGVGGLGCLTHCGITEGWANSGRGWTVSWTAPLRFHSSTKSSCHNLAEPERLRPRVRPPCRRSRSGRGSSWRDGTAAASSAMRRSCTASTQSPTTTPTCSSTGTQSTGATLPAARPGHWLKGRWPVPAPWCACQSLAGPGPIIWRARLRCALLQDDWLPAGVFPARPRGAGVLSGHSGAADLYLARGDACRLISRFTASPARHLANRLCSSPGLELPVSTAACPTAWQRCAGGTAGATPAQRTLRKLGVTPACRCPSTAGRQPGGPPHALAQPAVHIRAAEPDAVARDQPRGGLQCSRAIGSSRACVHRCGSYAGAARLSAPAASAPGALPLRVEGSEAHVCCRDDEAHSFVMSNLPVCFPPPLPADVQAVVPGRRRPAVGADAVPPAEHGAGAEPRAVGASR